MKQRTLLYGGVAVGIASVAVCGQSVMAQEAPAAAPAADAPWTPAPFWDSFSLGVEAEVGITANPNNSSVGNFGQLFTDKENQILLNQFTVTAARPFDPKATGFDWGFRIQGMYGTDARYTHFLGELDDAVKERTQFDVLEASLSAHLPVLTDGGVDIKFGQYPTPIGYEVIEPAGNPFYSHSYIFNFGIPLKHTGGYLTAHLNDTFDLWLGGDTGVNTSYGSDGDQNGKPAFLGGIGINGLLDGKLTILALTHGGPENPTFIAPKYGFRYLNDVVTTYKATDSLTFVTDLNYIQDDALLAHPAAHSVEGWGVAEYVEYAASTNLALNFRAELYRDNQGFFVAAFPGNMDFVNVEKGLPSTAYGFGPSTYSEFSVNAQIKPDVPDAFSGLMIRPELRYDQDLEGDKVFKGNTAQFTAAIDIVIPFAIIAPPAAAAEAPAAPPPAAAPPAPAAPTVEAQRSFQVFFDFDKSDITSAAAKVIQAAADSVKAGHMTKITVTGHTDTVGSAKYNQGLSERRAAAVKTTLVSDGVASGEITTIGVGKTGLLVPTADGVREPQNRRAEIVLQ